MALTTRENHLQLKIPRQIILPHISDESVGRPLLFLPHQHHHQWCCVSEDEDILQYYPSVKIHQGGICVKKRRLVGRKTNGCRQADGSDMPWFRLLWMASYSNRGAVLCKGGRAVVRRVLPLAREKTSDRRRRIYRKRKRYETRTTMVLVERIVCIDKTALYDVYFLGRKVLSAFLASSSKRWTHIPKHPSRLLFSYQKT